MLVSEGAWYNFARRCVQAVQPRILPSANQLVDSTNAALPLSCSGTQSSVQALMNHTKRRAPDSEADVVGPAEVVVGGRAEEAGRDRLRQQRAPAHLPRLQAPRCLADLRAPVSSQPAGRNASPTKMSAALKRPSRTLAPRHVCVPLTSETVHSQGSSEHSAALEALRDTFTLAYAYWPRPKGPRHLMPCASHASHNTLF